MANKKTSVVFIKPRSFTHEVIEEPLGILYLASYIRNEIKDVQINIIDAHLEKFTPVEILDELKKISPDFICISTITSGSIEAYKLVNILKQDEETKNVTVIFGGPHPTALPEECLRQGVDFCVIGEGEVTLLELISCLIDGKPFNNLPGIVYKDELNNIEYNPSRELIPNLSDLPYPAFDLIDILKYSTSIHLYPENKNEIAFPIMASRGCPFECIFCCSKTMWRKSVRFRTVESVVNEIIEMYNKYNVSQFHFYDDNFFVNPDFTKTFAEEIIARDINIKFTCQTNCRSFLNADGELINNLKKAGLSVLELGIETLSYDVLKVINKPEYITDIQLLVKKLQKYEIDVYPLIMYLAPGETLKGHVAQSKEFLSLFSWSKYIKDTYNFKEDIFLFNGGAFTPFPGTHAFQHIEDYGILLTYDWQKYNTENVVFIPFSLLADVPCKNAKYVSPGVRERIKKMHEKALQFNLVNNIDNAIDKLWNGIDGKKNIKELAEYLYLSCNQDDDMNSLMAFVSTSVLILLLNEEHVLPKS